MYDFNSLVFFSSASSYEPSRLWYWPFYSVVLSIKSYVSLPGELTWPTAYILNHGYHNNITNTNIQQWAPGRGIWTARWPYSRTGLLGVSWHIVSNGRWTWHGIRIAGLLLMGRTMTPLGSGLHPTAPPLFREISLLVYISYLGVLRCRKISVFWQKLSATDCLKCNT